MHVKCSYNGFQLSKTEFPQKLKKKNGLEIVLKKRSYFLSMQNLGPILQKKFPWRRLDEWYDAKRSFFPNELGNGNQPTFFVLPNDSSKTRLENLRTSVF